MIPTIQTTFKGTAHSDAIESLVQKEAAKLDRLFDRITSCHVVIEKPHRHQLSGAPFEVRITLAVPGEEIVVTHVSTEHDTEHKYAHVAVQDAFRRAGRRLHDYARKLADLEKSGATR